MNEAKSKSFHDGNYLDMVGDMAELSMPYDGDEPKIIRAASSAVEHSLDMGRATGSIPVPPTNPDGRPRLRYLRRETTRHGRVCWYFRKGDGPRVRLPHEIGTPPFMRAYKAAFNAKSGMKITPRVRQKEERTYVYFMKAGRRVKIGFSSDPKKRAASMQTAIPEKIKIALKIKGGRELEREMHARFRDLHIGGEWFAYRGELSAFVEGRELIEIVL